MENDQPAVLWQQQQQPAQQQSPLPAEPQPATDTTLSTISLPIQLPEPTDPTAVDTTAEDHGPQDLSSSLIATQPVNTDSTAAPVSDPLQLLPDRRHTSAADVTALPPARASPAAAESAQPSGHGTVEPQPHTFLAESMTVPAADLPAAALPPPAAEADAHQPQVDIAGKAHILEPDSAATDHAGTNQDALAPAAAAAGGGGGGGTGGAGSSGGRRRGKKHPKQPPPGAKAQLKGVFWDRKTGRWRSQLGYHNKKIFMGYFNTPQEAAEAYDKKAVELHGRLAKTNFPIHNYANLLPAGTAAIPTLEMAIPTAKKPTAGTARATPAAAAAAAAEVVTGTDMSYESGSDLNAGDDSAMQGLAQQQQQQTRQSAEGADLTGAMQVPAATAAVGDGDAAGSLLPAALKAAIAPGIETAGDTFRSSRRAVTTATAAARSAPAAAAAITTAAPVAVEGDWVTPLHSNLMPSPAASSQQQQQRAPARGAGNGRGGSRRGAAAVAAAPRPRGRPRSNAHQVLSGWGRAGQSRSSPDYGELGSDDEYLRTRHNQQRMGISQAGALGLRTGRPTGPGSASSRYRSQEGPLADPGLQGLASCDLSAAQALAGLLQLSGEDMRTPPQPRQQQQQDADQEEYGAADDHRYSPDFTPGQRDRYTEGYYAGFANAPTFGRAGVQKQYRTPEDAWQPQQRGGTGRAYSYSAADDDATLQWQHQGYDNSIRPDPAAAAAAATPAQPWSGVRRRLPTSAAVGVDSSYSSSRGVGRSSWQQHTGPKSPVNPAAALAGLPWQLQQQWGDADASGYADVGQPGSPDAPETDSRGNPGFDELLSLLKTAVAGNNREAAQQQVKVEDADRNSPADPELKLLQMVQQALSGRPAAPAPTPSSRAQSARQSLASLLVAALTAADEQQQQHHSRVAPAPQQGDLASVMAALLRPPQQQQQQQQQQEDEQEQEDAPQFVLQPPSTSGRPIYAQTAVAPAASLAAQYSAGAQRQRPTAAAPAARLQPTLAATSSGSTGFKRRANASSKFDASRGLGSMQFGSTAGQAQTDTLHQRQLKSRRLWGPGTPSGAAAASPGARTGSSPASNRGLGSLLPATLAASSRSRPVQAAQQLQLPQLVPLQEIDKHAVIGQQQQQRQQQPQPPKESVSDLGSLIAMLADAVQPSATVPPSGASMSPAAAAAAATAVAATTPESSPYRFASGFEPPMKRAKTTAYDDNNVQDAPGLIAVDGFAPAGGLDSVASVPATPAVQFGTPQHQQAGHFIYTPPELAAPSIEAATPAGHPPPPAAAAADDEAVDVLVRPALSFDAWHGAATTPAAALGAKRAAPPLNSMVTAAAADPTADAAAPQGRHTPTAGGRGQQTHGDQQQYEGEYMQKLQGLGYRTHIIPTQMAAPTAAAAAVASASGSSSVAADLSAGELISDEAWQQINSLLDANAKGSAVAGSSSSPAAAMVDTDVAVRVHLEVVPGHGQRQQQPPQQISHGHLILLPIILPQQALSEASPPPAAPDAQVNAAVTGHTVDDTFQETKVDPPLELPATRPAAASYSPAPDLSVLPAALQAKVQELRNQIAAMQGGVLTPHQDTQWLLKQMVTALRRKVEAKKQELMQEGQQ